MIRLDAACPACGHGNRFPAVHAGLDLPCSACGAPVRVPVEFISHADERCGPRRQGPLDGSGAHLASLPRPWWRTPRQWGAMALGNRRDPLLLGCTAAVSILALCAFAAAVLPLPQDDQPAAFAGLPPDLAPRLWEVRRDGRTQVLAVLPVLARRERPGETPAWVGELAAATARSAVEPPLAPAGEPPATGGAELEANAGLRRARQAEAWSALLGHGSLALERQPPAAAAARLAAWRLEGLGWAWRSWPLLGVARLGPALPVPAAGRPAAGDEVLVDAALAGRDRLVEHMRHYEMRWNGGDLAAITGSQAITDNLPGWMTAHGLLRAERAALAQALADALAGDGRRTAFATDLTAFGAGGVLDRLQAAGCSLGAIARGDERRWIAQWELDTLGDGPCDPAAVADALRRGARLDRLEDGRLAALLRAEPTRAAAAQALAARGAAGRARLCQALADDGAAATSALAALIAGSDDDCQAALAALAPLPRRPLPAAVLDLLAAAGDQGAARCAALAAACDAPVEGGCAAVAATDRGQAFRRGLLLRFPGAAPATRRLLAPVLAAALVPAGDPAADLATWAVLVEACERGALAGESALTGEAMLPYARRLCPARGWEPAALAPEGRALVGRALACCPAPELGALVVAATAAPHAETAAAAAAAMAGAGDALLPVLAAAAADPGAPPALRLALVARGAGAARWLAAHLDGVPGLDPVQAVAALSLLGADGARALADEAPRLAAGSRALVAERHEFDAAAAAPILAGLRDAALPRAQRCWWAAVAGRIAGDCPEADRLLGELARGLDATLAGAAQDALARRGLRSRR